MAIGNSIPAAECPDITSWTLFSGDYDYQKPVLVDAADPSRFVTKSTAIQMVASLTGVFRPNSSVVLHLANDITYPLLYLAIFASKSRWVGTNISYTPSELTHAFATCEADYIVVGQEHFEIVTTAVKETGRDTEIILWTDILANPSLDSLPNFVEPPAQTPTTQRYIHELQHNGSIEELTIALDCINVDDTATLMSTSGTTSLPKMAARTHRSHVLETLAMQDNHADKDYEVIRLFATPIFHAFSSPEMLTNALRLGTKSYFMKRFNPVVFPALVQKYGVTEIHAPPGVISQLLGRAESHPQIQTLRGIYTGGAPFAPELRARFLSIFKDNPNPPHIRAVYGMTEGGYMTTFKHPIDDDTGSVGNLIPGYKMKMLAEGEYFTELTNGTEVGLLYVHSPYLMTHYMGNKKETDESFDKDGWLNTGDIGYIQDSKVYIVDRAKDLIKVNGWQVSPSELENAIVKHRSVGKVAVIGTGSGEAEHPLAFVSLVRGIDPDTVTGPMLKEFLLPSLTKYKVNRIEYLFVQEKDIPVSGTGKVLKQELRARVARGVYQLDPTI